MKRTAKQKAVERKNLDEVMRNSYHHLVSDLTSLSGTKFGKVARELLESNDMKRFRELSWPIRTDKSVITLKAEYQMENYLKRYRFSNDCFTDRELEQRTIDLEQANIIRAASPQEWDNEIVFRVLQEARKLCRKILGKYDPERHLSLCRFGKKSSVGTPYKQSYLDCKMEGPLTGSKEHIDWFSQTAVPGDNILHSAIQDAQLHKLDNPEFWFTDRSSLQYAICSTLKFVTVPKSWKIFRGITPNTTVGGYYSAGLGEYMAQSLRDNAHLNIKTLQETHGFLAELYSLVPDHVTADLSAASPSILWGHCVRVFPRDWHNAMNKGRIRYLELGGSRVLNPIYAGMGIGFTFPMQTLLFYCILCSIKKLSGCNYGRVSVYGDDLIYPRKMHKVVEYVFPKINFKINGDKTYVSEYFRESCGKDFYHGCTVRPYSFEGSASNLNRHDLTATIYKLINGLRAKWDDVEIPQTLKYLYELVANTIGKIHVVPPSYPDTAGVKMATPSFLKDWWMPWLIPKWVGVTNTGKIEPCWWLCKTGTWMFDHLVSSPSERTIQSCYPYYWDRMRTSTAGNTEIGDYHSVFEDVRDLVSLKWRHVKPRPKTYRSKLTGKRLIKLEPVVAVKGYQRVQLQRSTIPEWSRIQ